MKNRMFIILVACLSLLGSVGVVAQETETSRPKRAWEFGLGGSLINWNRVSISGFQQTPDQYLYDLRVDHLMGGVNLYIAHELNPWFYLDLQGNIGLAKDRHSNQNKYNQLYMGGLGLQFRLSPLFKSQYVEPYLRVGVNYLHKSFDSITSGNFREDPTGQATWKSSDIWNPKGTTVEKDSFFPLSFGAGVNAWLNNSLGLGIQGEYLMPVRQGLPSFAQVSLRLMYRLGGKSKKPAPVVEIQTIERPVEKIVERLVEREVFIPGDTVFFALFNEITFEFDKYTLTPESASALDKAAEVLKKHTDLHFVITGFTDIRGGEEYNVELSEKRAETVKNALVERGVPAYMLKTRGVGKATAAMEYEEAHHVRMGDRKVTIELITNMEYWEKLD